MVTETLIDEILAHPFDREWSIQGLGMLRTYLDDEHVTRLHIWDDERAFDDVSTIHDHPWDFTSRIVRGEIHNQRFSYDAAGQGSTYWRAKIRCGEGGGLLTDAEPVHIVADSLERYQPGESYSMLAPEMHESHPSRGAVSVIERSFQADRDVATVCWRTGDWVSAEPRPVTRAEIEHFVALARTA